MFNPVINSTSSQNELKRLITRLFISTPKGWYQMSGWTSSFHNNTLDFLHLHISPTLAFEWPSNQHYLIILTYIITSLSWLFSFVTCDGALGWIGQCLNDFCALLTDIILMMNWTGWYWQLTTFQLYVWCFYLLIYMFPFSQHPVWSNHQARGLLFSESSIWWWAVVCVSFVKS